MGLRSLLRIARWEVTKNAGGIDRRTVLVAVGAIALLGLVAPVVASGGVGLDDGIYRIGVTEDSRYYEVAADDDTFAIRPDAGSRALEAGSVELLATDGRIRVAESQKGQAALEEFRSSVERYNEERLSEADNQTAAFPVYVTLQYQPQTQAGSTFGAGGSGGDSDGSGGGSDASGSAGESGGSSGGSTDGSGGAGSGSGQPVGPDEVSGGGGVGGFAGSFGGDAVSGSPSSISPPFPFRSLVLAFLFVIPLNFIIQAYGSSILSERLNRRGELMLVSPVSRFDIIGGKTLPYALGALGAEAVIAVAVSYALTGSPGGVLSIVAMAPLVLLFLSATFLGAMFARSFKELTFVTVTITVTLTSYAFVPAIFTDVGAVALISPLTLVVRDLQNEAISLAEFAFSITPPTLTALSFFGLGAGLYREEDLFTQRPIPLKVLDALAGPIRRPWHAALVTAALVPFVLLAELLSVAFLFALGEVSVPLVLIFVAIIEEIGKSLHVYAAYAHNRFERSLRSALALGLASGVGFFLVEKVIALGQVVGLGDVPTGNAVLRDTLPSGPLILALFLAPLVLHVVTASISAVGASRNRRAYLVALGIAMAVHLAYNLAIVEVITGV